MNCPKCFNKYNNNKNIPRILHNCGHTFCEECLDELLSKNNKLIICPLCKLETQVEDTIQLTKNLVLLEPNVSPHISTTSINTISDSVSSLSKFKAKVVCQLHLKDLEAFCETCKEMLCVGCILENVHKNHDLNTIDKSFQKEKTHIESKYEKAIEMEKKMNQNLQKISEQKDQIEMKVMKILESNKKFYSDLIQIIEDREVQIENKIKKMKEEEFENLDNQKETIYSKIELINEFKQFKSGMDSFSEVEILLKSKNNSSLIEQIEKVADIDINLISNKSEYPLHELNKDDEISIIKKNMSKLIIKANNNDDILNVQQQIANVQAKLQKIDKGKNNINSVYNNLNTNNNILNVQISLNSDSNSSSNTPNYRATPKNIAGNSIINENLTVSRNSVKALKNKKRQTNQIASNSKNNKANQSELSTNSNIIESNLGNSNRSSKRLALHTSTKIKNANEKLKIETDFNIKKKVEENIFSENLRFNTEIPNELSNTGSDANMQTERNIINHFNLHLKDNSVEYEADIVKVNLNVENKNAESFKKEVAKSNDKIKENFDKIANTIKNNQLTKSPTLNPKCSSTSNINPLQTSTQPISPIPFDNPINNNNATISNTNMINNFMMENSVFDNLSPNKKVNKMNEIADKITLDPKNSINFSSSKLFNQDMASLYLSSNSYILTIGGKADNASRRYCVESDQWSNYEIQVDRSDYSAVNYKDKKILILGGRITTQGIENISDTIDLLNTRDRTMKKLEIKMKYPRANFGVVYFNNKLFVAGGFSGKEVLNSFEYFEKRSRVWNDLPKMLIKRKEFGMVIGPDNSIYVIGGSDEKE